MSKALYQVKESRHRRLYSVDLIFMNFPEEIENIETAHQWLPGTEGVGVEIINERREVFSAAEMF